jgi:uncharacterized protein YjbI with pentapeptide repeats
MPLKKKSAEKRYSFGLDIQKRAKCLLEALLDQADEARKFGTGFKKEGIEITFLKSGLGETGIKFKVKRNLLANLSGIKTENLTSQEAKNLYDLVSNVVICLNKFKIISAYSAQKTGWWELIMPSADKNECIKKFSALVESDLAIANPHQESVERDAGSIEERYFRATSQFDSLEPLERKSRIQVLEEIAEDSQRYHWKVMNFLANFVKKNARPKKNAQEDEGRTQKPREDIQEALRVIGGRDPNNNKGLFDLSNTDIRGAELHGANLQGVNLNEANLQGTELYVAQLQGAFLNKTQLHRARLIYANLQGAYLGGANLQSADLTEVNLREADLTGANLQGAILQKADLYEADFHEAKLQGTYLYGATNLKLQQIEFAYGDSTTVLPNDVERPAHWI